MPSQIAVVVTIMVMPIRTLMFAEVPITPLTIMPGTITQDMITRGTIMDAPLIPMLLSTFPSPRNSGCMAMTMERRMAPGGVRGKRF